MWKSKNQRNWSGRNRREFTARYKEQQVSFLHFSNLKWIFTFTHCAGSSDRTLTTRELNEDVSLKFELNIHGPPRRGGTIWYETSWLPVKFIWPKVKEEIPWAPLDTWNGAERGTGKCNFAKCFHWYKKTLRVRCLGIRATPKQEEGSRNRRAKGGGRKWKNRRNGWEMKRERKREGTARRSRRKLQARRIYLPSKLKWIIYVDSIFNLSSFPGPRVLPHYRSSATRNCYRGSKEETFLMNF